MAGRWQDPRIHRGPPRGQRRRRRHRRRLDRLLPGPRLRRQPPICTTRPRRPALRQLVETAWRSASRPSACAEGASLDRLTCTGDLAAAVAEADFVQESVPENLALKQAVYESWATWCRTDVVIASSTSGLSMSDMQARCATPERTVIAHPFNPPYLLPLVEMIGGAKTDPAAVDWAAGFYRHRRQVATDDEEGDSRLHRHPAAGSAVARGAAHGGQRRGDGRADRPGDRHRSGSALGPARALHGLSRGLRRRAAWPPTSITSDRP